MALSPHNMPSGHEKLYYFTGKVRAFWKDKIFFLDQRNAAIVGIESLYLNGEKASTQDLQRMDAKVASSDWESAPVFHSYVVKFSSNEAPPWPYKLKGKKLWLARYAWTGTIPSVVEEQLKGQNVVFMPITYYTGKLINLFNDKLLYGDYRNSVMVHISNLYIFGQRADYRDAMMHFDQHIPIIHSFVTKLSFLTSRNYDGPEPHLPTWPIDEYGPSTWVARYAWQGEMPDELRQQLSRFEIVKINDWDNDFGPGNIPRPFAPSYNYPLESSFSVEKNVKSLENGTSIFPEPLLATTQKEAAIVKGSLLLGNHKYGLINSYLDIIVFSTKNFYVNGEVFREGMALSDFFHSRKIPLTAWIVPLPEPILVFDVYVMWRAVCVWYGVPPRNMEAIKNRYDNGIIAGTVPQALNTTSDNKYTLVMGEISTVSHNNGFARARVGDRTIDITFKRKAVYLYGYKLHSKCSLVEKSQVLETGTWTMLVYPIVIENADAVKVHYVALALWQYQYQHYVAADLFYRILTEGNALISENETKNVDIGDLAQDDDTKGRHMSGWVVKCCQHYGIIESRSVTAESTYIYFNRTDLYVDGNVLEDKPFIHQLDKKRQVNLYAQYAEYQEIKGFPVTMAATLVWMGKKPCIAKPSSHQEPLMPLPNEPYESDYDSPDIISPVDENFQRALQVIRPSSPVMEHKAGRFVYLGDRFGVIRCGNKRLIDDDYILFDFSVLWIDGKRLDFTEGLYDNVIYDEVQCNLTAYAIPNCDVGGYPVNMQATAVWLGKKPPHIRIPGINISKSVEGTGKQTKQDLESSFTLKDLSSYVNRLNNTNKPTTKKDDKTSDIANKLARMNLKDSKEGKNTNTKGAAKIVIDPKNPYVGKHLGARILKLGKDIGVAKWRCAALEADVYIEFSRKVMFVNLCPMNDNYELGKMRAVNFFVIPMKAKEVEGFTVSLKATCGWIGSKPSDIPIPGQQDHSQISLEGVHSVDFNIGKHVSARVVKLMKEKGIARWRSAALGGDVFLEFDKWDACATVQLLFEHTLDFEEEYPKCHFYVVPIKHKEVCGYTISLSATCSWLGKKPPHFPKPKTVDQMDIPVEKLHVTPVDPELMENEFLYKDKAESPPQVKGTVPKDKSIKALDNVSPDVKNNSTSTEKSDVLKEKLETKKKKKSKNEVWEEDDDKKTDLEGKIVELHSNVGRLEGTDGEQHFFSRENCYLYGVTLSSVELWHVLVQDEKAMYRLTEISAGQTKVSKMWIGSETIDDADKAAAYIYEWCSKHLVPDGARELLVHQLELSKASSTA